MPRTFLYHLHIYFCILAKLKHLRQGKNEKLAQFGHREIMFIYSITLELETFLFTRILLIYKGLSGKINCEKIGSYQEYI